MTTEALGRRARLQQLLGGIRVRVVVGYVALLLAALAITLVATRGLLLSRLDRQIQDDFTQEVEELRNLAEGNDPTTGAPFGGDVAAIFKTFLSRNVPSEGEAFFTLLDGRPHLESAEAPASLFADPELVEAWRAITEPLRRTTASPAGEALTLAVPVRAADAAPGVFVVAIFPQEARQELTDTLRLIALASGIVILLSASVAWGLAGRVLRPVRELTDTAQRITDSDLTARIPVEGHDELAELGHTFNDMLERLDRGVRGQRQFLDDVAHELRTPLTIMRGHLEVSGTDPEDHATTVALVTDELDRMGRYVDDLLVLAKAEQGELLRLEPVDLGELAEGLLLRVPALGDREWSIGEAPAPGHVAAVADAGRLEQAVLALATNAVQHTEPGAPIELGVRVEAGAVELWVRDHGSGVAPDVRDQVFERATRGAGSRVARPGGTGIGLAIVKAVADAHGGRATVGDTPGGGATFTLIVPLDPEATTP